MWLNNGRCLIVALLVVVSHGSPAVSKAQEYLLDPFYKNLTRAEKGRAVLALQDALERLPSRQTLQWRLDSGAAGGSVSPLRSFKIKTGHFCRVFEERLETPDGQRRREATACRIPAGRWIPLN